MRIPGARLMAPRIMMIWSDRFTRIALIVLLLILTMGVFGPNLAPYSPDKIFYTDEGSVDRLSPPTKYHILGTNDIGQDVFSRILAGARPTVLTGLIGGFLMAGIGFVVGLTAGYSGGIIDETLMRVTDFFYGVPFIPTAIVLLAFVGGGFWTVVLVIGVLLWRTSARVLRSQVLQIKERDYVLVAQSSGASPFYIATRHILPNIMSMIALYFALGVGSAMLNQTNLAYLGFADPFLPSWGNIIRNAYNSGAIGLALWWSLPPGILISITVISIFVIGRSFEQVQESKKLEI